ncbi:MAG: hypothetical protein HDS82_04955 [Bacteroidales bacterium]|nr:hypothetical protein [Bacteroidales bacterium]
MKKYNIYFAGLWSDIRHRLSKLSFRTGVIVLLTCIPFYIISFAQMALPISTSVKGVLWVVFFGLAKTAQYGGLTILGAEGIKRLKAYWVRNKRS